MKIGDTVYIRGTIDEIRKDVVIIRNKGGYFGTVTEEIEANIGDYTDIGDFSDILWLTSRNRAFDEVLEIIDQAQYKTITLADGSYVLHTDRSVLRDAVLALKGGEQE